VRMITATIDTTMTPMTKNPVKIPAGMTRRQMSVLPSHPQTFVAPCQAKWQKVTEPYGTAAGWAHRHRLLRRGRVCARPSRDVVTTAGIRLLLMANVECTGVNRTECRLSALFCTTV
jgi:hypothetical protein